MNEYFVAGDVVGGEQQIFKVFTLAEAKRWKADGYVVRDAQGYII